MRLHYLDLGIKMLDEKAISGNEFATMQTIIKALHQSENNSIRFSTADCKKVLSMSFHNVLKTVTKLSLMNIIKLKLPHGFIMIELPCVLNDKPTNND